MTDPTIGNAVVTPLEKYNQAGNQAQQTHNKANCWPIPVVYVHGSAQAERPYDQVEVRQAFINWF